MTKRHIGNRHEKNRFLEIDILSTDYGLADILSTEAGLTDTWPKIMFGHINRKVLLKGKAQYS
jgi:hypothetical protein